MIQTFRKYASRAGLAFGRWQLTVMIAQLRCVGLKLEMGPARAVVHTREGEVGPMITPSSSPYDYCSSTGNSGLLPRVPAIAD